MADDVRPPIQGDAGIDCPCGGRMLYKTFSGVPREVACPRCGKTPLDLLQRVERNPVEDPT